MPKSKDISARAKRMWQRLVEWYGTRITEMYGATPPPEWCEVIDAIDNDAVKRGLSKIRANCVQHPPTFPEFERAMRPPNAGPSRGPTPAERLCEYVARAYWARLTAAQKRGPWTYLHTAEGECTGVVIDADGVTPGYRVMLADIGAPDWFDAQLSHQRAAI